MLDGIPNGDPGHAGDLAALVAALGAPGTASEAARSLGTMRPALDPSETAPVGQALVAAFASDPSPSVGAAIRTWGGVAAVLIGAASGAGSAVRREIEDLLGTMGPEAVPALVEALRDPDPAVRLTAVRALHRVRRTATREIQEGHRRAVVEANRGMRGPNWLGEARAGFARSPRGRALEDRLRRIDEAAGPLRAVAEADPEPDVRATAQKASRDFPPSPGP